MAGDWIKMRANLDGDPRVIRISELLNIPELHTVGALWKVWSWADQHTTNGNAPGVTLSFVDRLTGVSGLAAAMKEVGWLDDSDGLSLPNFGDHNGQTAKTRALTNNRVKRIRNAASVTPALPEKRREEKIEVPNISATTPVDGCQQTSTVVNSRQQSSTVVNIDQRCDTPDAPDGAIDKRGKKVGVQQRPSEGEAEAYASKIGLPMAEVAKFFAFYDSKNWMVGKNPMTKWRGAMSGWKLRWEERRNQERARGGSGHRVDMLDPAEIDAASIREIQSLEKYAEYLANQQ